MRFPHRVVISDPRNRQPPAGVSYVASRYDVVRYRAIFNSSGRRFNNEGDVIDYLNQDHTEPVDSEPVKIEVPALISMTNDGDRNLSNIAYSIRMPITEYKKAQEFLNDQRQFSREQYGYTSEPLPRVLVRRGLDLDIVTLQAVSSSELALRVPLNELSVEIPTTLKNPFAIRNPETYLEYNFDISDDVEDGITGFIPPAQSWGDGDVHLWRSTNNRPFSTKVTLRDFAYKFSLFVSRIDTYEDLVEFRCFDPAISL